MLLSIIDVGFRLITFPFVWQCVAFGVAFVSAATVAIFKGIRNKEVTNIEQMKIGSFSIFVGLVITIMINL